MTFSSMVARAKASTSKNSSLTPLYRILGGGDKNQSDMSAMDRREVLDAV